MCKASPALSPELAWLPSGPIPAEEREEASTRCPLYPLIQVPAPNVAIAATRVLGPEGPFEDRMRQLSLDLHPLPTGGSLLRSVPLSPCHE